MGNNKIMTFPVTEFDQKLHKLQSQIKQWEAKVARDPFPVFREMQREIADCHQQLENINIALNPAPKLECHVGRPIYQSMEAEMYEIIDNARKAAKARERRIHTPDVPPEVTN